MLPVEDMTLAAVVDELGEVRAQVSLLKARESELRNAILDARSNAPVRGDAFESFVRRGETRRIDKARLPVAMLTDPRYWTRTATEKVITRPLQGT